MLNKGPFKNDVKLKRGVSGGGVAEVGALNKTCVKCGTAEQKSRFMSLVNSSLVIKVI